MILIDAWLSLPLPTLILILAAFYGASALMLIGLSFGDRSGLELLKALHPHHHELVLAFQCTNIGDRQALPWHLLVL